MRLVAPFALSSLAGLVFLLEASLLAAQVPDPEKPVVVAYAALPDGPVPQPAEAASSSASAGDINGTVTDTNGDIIPGATVVLQGQGPADRRSVTANDNGFFEFTGVRAGVSYQITIKAQGFDDWDSPNLVLTPGQYVDLTKIQLKLPAAVSSVTVYSSTVQIATEQVRLEEQQRVLGIVPNFYVVYNAKDAVPLTAKLKFQMAYRLSIDPVAFAGAAFMAGINQAGDTPNYQQGLKGYGQRFGAGYADGVTDIMFGGAILPSLLHQDPRYYYQGTGTIRSRTLHALAYPFICKGDNGRLQPNYSTIGGDLISAAISNAYYPQSNRGVNLVYENLLIGTAERAASTLAQEFVFRKLTPKPRNPE